MEQLYYPLNETVTCKTSKQTTENYVESRGLKMIYEGIDIKVAVHGVMIDYVFKINTVAFLYFGLERG